MDGLLIFVKQIDQSVLVLPLPLPLRFFVLRNSNSLSHQKMTSRIGMEQEHTLPADRFQFHGRMAAFVGERRSPSEIYELNLRYQLLERMKVRGLRSLASQHHVRDSHIKEQRDMGGPSWDSRHHLSPQPQGCSPIGSGRFQGRIIFPQQRSSSPEDHRIPDFAGPKSLAELKGGKEKKQLHSPGGGRQRNPKVGLEEGFDTAFEPPKPLSVILKRKREEIEGMASSSYSCDDEVVLKKRVKVGLGGTSVPAVAHSPPNPLSAILERKREVTGGMTPSSYNCDEEVGPKKMVKEGLGGTSVPETCSAAAHSRPAKLDYAHNDKEERKPNEDTAVDDRAVEDQGDDYMECDDMNGCENEGTVQEELLEGDDEDEDAFSRSIGVFPT